MDKSEKKERPQNKFLKPMVKGETRNPNGRPIGAKNRSTIVRELLAKIADMDKFAPKNAEALRKMGLPTKTSLESIITAAQIVKAAAGDTRAYEALQDSGYGKPSQTIDAEIKGKVTLPRVTLISGKK